MQSEFVDPAWLAYVRQVQEYVEIPPLRAKQMEVEAQVQVMEWCRQGLDPAEAAGELLAWQMRRK